jgi:hypothetical protein
MCDIAFWGRPVVKVQRMVTLDGVDYDRDVLEGILEALYDTDVPGITLLVGGGAALMDMLVKYGAASKLINKDAYIRGFNYVDFCELMEYTPYGSLENKE